MRRFQSVPFRASPPTCQAIRTTRLPCAFGPPGARFLGQCSSCRRTAARQCTRFMPFCREVEDIAASEASRALKYTLLGNWRSEIALLYAGRPQHVVSCALSEPVRQYSLQCADFLAIIDGMEMDRSEEHSLNSSHVEI